MTRVLPGIEELKEDLEPVRRRLVEHPMYGSIDSLAKLRRFMEYHVFAVWDFMSLLKSLQRRLTSTELPWVPVGDGETRYLINEIVTGEESDITPDGRRLSHFELYLEAMQEAGADTSSIEYFITLLHKGLSVSDALEAATVAPGIRDFVKNTFHTITAEPIHVQAAVFTFGREDLIPDMFISMVQKLSLPATGKTQSLFEYYLERHIEVDGGHHSQLAYQMTSELCGSDSKKWAEAKKASEQALEARIHFWDIISAASA